MCEMSPAAVLLAMVVLTLTPPSLADTCALYDPPVPGIHCFQGNALDRVVTSSKTLWMIEFYSRWCGHCQHFAPVMKEIGTEIEAWSSTFKLGVIDCSGSKDSQNACNRHKIQAYPTLKFYSSNDPSPLEHSRTLHGARSKSYIIKTIINEIDGASAVQTFPPVTDVELLSVPEDSWIPLVFVFEKNNSYVGRRLILDFLSSHNVVMVRRVLDTNALMMKHYSILELPSLVVEMSKGDHHVVSGHMLKDKDPYEVFKKVILKYLYSLQSAPKDRSHKSTPRPHPHDPSPSFHYTPVKINRVHRNDLLSAVSYALRSEVPIHSIVSGSAYSSLLRFINLLEKAFATPFPMASQCLQGVRKAVERQSTGSFVTRTDWNRVIDTKLDDSVFPVTPHWTKCNGSLSHLRGYPCGLWMLMHSLTILTLPLPQTTPTLTVSGISSKESLRTVSSFVQNFLSCEPCREHFKNMSSDLTSKLHHDGDAILWLWEAHNTVNHRLRGTASSDPYYPKSLFPEAKTCPYCYHPTGPVTLDHAQPNFSNTGFLAGESLLENSKATNNVDFVWNRTAVLLYLWNFYHLDQHTKTLFDDAPSPPLVVRPVDIVKAAWPRKNTNTAQLDHKYYGRQELPNQRIGFSSIDSGLCVMSYGMCVGFLSVAAYWLYNKKRHRKKFF